MRDKVKRFISILMTALMLVNLLPVGALAEGVKISNSVQSIGWGSEPDPKEGTYDNEHVYVYVQIVGANQATLDKFKLNSSGWYTIGSIEKTMPGKGGWENKGSYFWPKWEWVITPTPDDNKTYQPGEETGAGELPPYSTDGLVPWEENKLIPLGKVEWQRYKFTYGANGYRPESVASWHMDGIVDFKKINIPYTVKHVVKGSSPETVLKEETKYQKYGQKTEAQALNFEGYKHVGEIVNQTIGDDPITIYVYYEPDGSTVDVTYKTDGNGTLDGNTNQTVGKVTGETLTDVEATPNTGYNFVGWYRGETFITKNLVLDDTTAKDNLKFINNGYKLYQDTTFTEKFEKNNYKLKINYKYEDGREAAKSHEETLQYQSGYSVTSPVIDGYTANNLVVSGTMPAGNVEVTVTYTKNSYKLKINYKYEDGREAAESHEETLPYQSDYSVTSPVIEGYTADKLVVSGKMPAGNVEETVTYTPRTDLSYTVNYYWNGTEIPVKPSKTVLHQTFGEEVTESPIGADDYTPVSTEPKKIKIGADSTQNVINFYYYRNVKLTANSDTKTYNGEDQSVSGYTCAVEEKQQDGSVEYVPWTGEKPLTFEGVSASGSGKDVNKNGYPVTFNESPIGEHDDLYYVKESQTGILMITPAPVTLQAPIASKTYDGTPLKAEDYGHSFVEGLDFADDFASISVEGSQTLVGSSASSVTYELKQGKIPNNYNIQCIPGTLTITPVMDEVLVKIKGNTANVAYDGKLHSVEGYAVDSISNPLYTANDFTYNGVAKAEGTDAATYPMNLAETRFKNTNTNFKNVRFEVVTDGSLTISKRPVTLTSETAGKTYDGTALEKPVVTVGGDGFVEGQVKEIKATGSVTNAGSVANTITFTPDKETFKESNYAITKNEGKLTITKRSVLLTSQSATKTYDGSALTRPAVTITGDGFVPGELAKVEATGSITNVGSTPNAIQYTTTGAFNPANYSIALSVGTLTVTAKPEPEPRRTFNLTVNYVYQNGKRAAASYNRGGLKNGETFDITSPVIAGYTASETVVSGTIDNRDIKVTVIYTADGVNLDDYGVPLGLGNITMNVGDCFE